MQCINMFFTNLDAPMPAYLNDLANLMRLVKVAVDVKQASINQVATSVTQAGVGTSALPPSSLPAPTPTSSEEIKIVDGSSFPKHRGKKRKSNNRVLLDVAFLRRSDRKTPSAYR